MEILLPSLKRLRKAAGLTQQQLADAAKISVATISKHEQGAINGIDGDTLDAIRGVLKCERHDLFLPVNSDISELEIISPVQEAN